MTPPPGEPRADSVRVATSGSINRHDKCPTCEKPMLFRVKDGKPIAKFCGSESCFRWLVEVPMPPPSSVPTEERNWTHGGCCAGRVCVLEGFPENCSCSCHVPATPPDEPLDFSRLRAINVSRCVNGFGHTLESWSVAEWTNALCGEAGEAANVAKKMLRHRDAVAGNRGEDLDVATLREKLGRELADVVIYADLCAAAQGIDLGAVVRETFNRKSEKIGAKERL